MEPLESLDGGKGAPVYRVDVPDANGPHDAAYAVAKQANRDNAQDHRGRAQRKAVEEILRCEDLYTGRGVRGGRGGDRANGVFFQVPRSTVDERHDPDPSGRCALTPFLSPTRFVLVTSGEELSPRLADEVRNEDDESAGDGDFRGFELYKGLADTDLKGNTSVWTH